MKKKKPEVLADPPAPGGAPSAESMPTVGSIMDELNAAAPSELGPMAEGEKPKRGRKKKGEPEETPAPSPFGPFGVMTRKLVEPYYAALECECPAEPLWVMWGEQGGEVLKYYMPDFSDHPLAVFTLSSFLLAAPVLGTLAARYVKQQQAVAAGSSPRNVHLRSARDGQEHLGQRTDIRVPPLPSP